MYSDNEEKQKSGILNWDQESIHWSSEDDLTMLYQIGLVWFLLLRMISDFKGLFWTAAKDMANGVTTGWERFDFDKEAPLDDEEIEGQTRYLLIMYKL